LNNQVRQQQALLQTRKDQGSTLRQHYEELDREAKELELAWHQGQAAILAAELKAGEPCPVCGSCAHPAPARSAAPLPTQQQVELARQKVRAENEALNLAREQFAEEQDRLRELQQQMNRCRIELGAEAERATTESEREINTLRTNAAQLALALPDSQRLQVMDPEQLRTAVEGKKSDAAAAKAQVNTAEQELPDAYRQNGALAQAANEMQQRIGELDRQIRRIATSHQQALSEATAARAASESAGLQRQKAETALQQARATCLSRLATSPFADEQEYQAALLSEERLNVLKTQIASYDAACLRLDGALQQLQEQLRGKERPDLEQFETWRNSAEAEKNQAVESWRQFDKRWSLLLDTRKKLQKAVADLAELDRQYAVVGTLSDVASGQTGNKISLQRFVLSVLLDDVLIEASHRLSLMSKGRYQLLRKEDRAKGNKASGLELEVEDAYTGKVRSVATLSGGESFMAALSLALGLSDVVQAYAGGIRLDTLFIDEGFGSLDAESLDLAILTLVDLQATGRMVGVISHVAELKEQMPLRLDVLAGRDGSHISLVAP
jgi:exonuclease SbcC